MGPILEFELDRKAPLPLCQQLHQQLREALEGGLFEPGSRLPATRRVATELGLHRATVVEAYRRLELEGWVDQRVGSGTYVRSPASAAASALRGRGGGPVAVGVAELLEQVRRVELPPVSPDALDLSTIVPDVRGFPSEAFHASLRRASERRGSEVLSYGPATGDAELRDLLAERLRRRGLPVEGSDLVVVAGAQQGIDLLLRAHAQPGDRVVVESPTYHHALDLLRIHRVEIDELPLHHDRGGSRSHYDSDELERCLSARPAVVYAQPNHQNPTGLTLRPESRVQLVEACARAGSLLIEDDYEAELHHDEDGRLKPLAAISDGAVVAHVGTLSKALFPGLRIGWIAGPSELIERVARVKRITDLSGSVILQAAAADLIATGEYDRHLEQVVAEGVRRLKTLGRALARELPPGFTATAPEGGHALWLELPPGLTGEALARRAAEEGVLVSPGELFSVRGGPGAVRLSTAQLDAAEIDDAVGRLARAARALMAEGPRPTRDPDLEAPLRI
ncbi:MAG: PLP-dependent aminotransferase family protein [Acidobacteriota bacterium]